MALDESFSSPSVHLLNTQYRMHPDIGNLISHLYYQGLLQNGVTELDRVFITASRPESGKAIVVKDLKGFSRCKRSECSYSRINEKSAEVVIECIEQIEEDLNIGIITPYADQAKYLLQLIKDKKLDDKRIECSTIHRFQGNERDIIIIDLTDAEPLEPGLLVRGTHGRNLLNVAVSRSRGKVIVIGEIEYFRKEASGSPVVELLDRMLIQS